MTVAGAGPEKPVVLGGAAISCQCGSALPTDADCPVEMITEIGSPHVGVGVGLLVAVRVGV
jgi:hypothetical protein